MPSQNIAKQENSLLSDVLFAFLHLATDHRPDGIRRILLHLRRGVGVGVQREAR